MCDEAVYGCLSALKFVPDWFVTDNVFESIMSLHSLIKIYSF